jgi:cytochrome c oxidase cbb3-type subunit 2
VKPHKKELWISSRRFFTMHGMFKKQANHRNTDGSHFPNTCLSLAIGLLWVVGSCTSTSAPAAPNLASQNPKKDFRSNSSQEKGTSLASDVTTKSQPVKEPPPAMASPPEAPAAKEALAKGKRAYQKHCAKCHGVNGDGQGPLAVDLSTKPQNFTNGVYKFRSTQSGELPTDEDLLRTISVGIPGTAMEGYQELPQPDRLALVAYLKSLSPRFLKSQQGTPIIFPVARPHTPESVTRGRQWYNQMQCSACHGADGRGDGELAQKLTDTAGEPIQPADLTRKRLKSGKGPEAIYRTIMTGLDGTPMPSYGYSLDPEEGWDLALYIFSLATIKESL